MKFFQTRRISSEPMVASDFRVRALLRRVRIKKREYQGLLRMTQREKAFGDFVPPPRLDTCICLSDVKARYVNLRRIN